jgi:hypothetical protein
MLTPEDIRRGGMRKTYRVLADIIAIEVVIQAMLIVWGIAGLFNWIDEGATLDKSVVKGWDKDPPTFEGAIGHFIHGMNGQFLIPLIGLALLVVSFFAKVPRGTTLAVVIVVTIAVQVIAGLTADAVPYIGLVHGLGAFIIFGTALAAAKAAKQAGITEPTPAAAV